MSRTNFTKETLNRIFTNSIIKEDVSNQFVNPQLEFNNSKNYTGFKKGYDWRIKAIIPSDGIFAVFGVYSKNGKDENGFIMFLDENYDQIIVSWEDENEEIKQLYVIDKFQYQSKEETIYSDLPIFSEVKINDNNEFYGLFKYQGDLKIFHFNNFTYNWFDEVLIYNLNNSFDFNNEIKFDLYLNGSKNETITKNIKTSEWISIEMVNTSYYLIGTIKTLNEPYGGYLKSGNDPENRDLYILSLNAEMKIDLKNYYKNLDHTSLINIKKGYFKISDKIVSLLYINEKANRLYYREDRSFSINDSQNATMSTRYNAPQPPYTGASTVWTSTQKLTISNMASALSSRYINRNMKQSSIEEFKATYTINGFTWTRNLSDKNTRDDWMNWNTNFPFSYSNLEVSSQRQSWAYIKDYDNNTLYPYTDFQRGGTFTKSFNVKANIKYIWHYDFTPINAVNILTLNLNDNSISYDFRKENVYDIEAYKNGNNWIFSGVQLNDPNNIYSNGTTFLFTYNISQKSLNTLEISKPYNRIRLRAIFENSNIFYIGVIGSQTDPTTFFAGRAFIIYNKTQSTFGVALSDSPIFFIDNVAAIKQQNKISIFSASPTFNDVYKFYALYDNSLNTSIPYFFKPYINDTKALIPQRFQFINDKEAILGDINIDDLALINNTLSMIGIIQKESLNSGRVSKVRIIGRTNKPIIELNTMISKIYNSTISYGYNYSINFKTINLINNSEATNNTIGLEIMKLHSQNFEENINDIIDNLAIRKVIFYSEQNTFLEYEIKKDDFKIIDNEIIYDMNFELISFLKNNLKAKNYEVTNGKTDSNKIIFHKEDLSNFDISNVLKIYFKIAYN